MFWCTVTYFVCYMNITRSEQQSLVGSNFLDIGRPAVIYFAWAVLLHWPVEESLFSDSCRLREKSNSCSCLLEQDAVTSFCLYTADCCTVCLHRPPGPDWLSAARDPSSGDVTPPMTCLLGHFCMATRFIISPWERQHTGSCGSCTCWWSAAIFSNFTVSLCLQGPANPFDNLSMCQIVRQTKDCLD